LDAALGTFLLSSRDRLPEGAEKEGSMPRTPAIRRSVTSREFSAETISELLRALHMRAAARPDSPGLIASWPGVREDHMAAACAELRRQGHAVRRVSIRDARRGTQRSGWAVGGTTYRPVVTPAAPEALARADAVLVRAVAEPSAVPSTRALLDSFAERHGASDAVGSAAALAVTEACANVVVHAYRDAAAPGLLEVRACVAGGVLFVEVADRGRGMLPRPDSPGLGMGLPLIAQMSDAFEILTHPAQTGVVVRMQFSLVRPDR
jgi:serine/threonine-protein kinase RsbW